jgi:hypothetical protein
MMDVLDLILFGTAGVMIVLTTTITAGTWAIFEKGGRPGWSVFVPLYNLIVLHQVAGKSAWWVLFYLMCPGVNIFTLLALYMSLCARFGKGFVYALGLLFVPFLFFPLLGFSAAQYQVPAR